MWNMKTSNFHPRGILSAIGSEDLHSISSQEATCFSSVGKLTMNSTSQQIPQTTIDGCTQNPEEAVTSHHHLQGHADDWVEDCIQELPNKRFRSFSSIRRQLGRRKKELQQEREQRELMEQPQTNEDSADIAHELGKPFLSSFTSCRLRNLRNKWKIEERETIVFENDENAALDSAKPSENTSDKPMVGASNSKRAKKKREKTRWMSRVKNRALILKGKPQSIHAPNLSNNKKKKKTGLVRGAKKKANAERGKPTLPLKTSTTGSSSLPNSFQQLMAKRLEQRGQQERSSKTRRQEGDDGDEEDQDISSADRVVVGVEEELLREATNDFAPSLVYPKGIQPGTSNNKERNRPTAYTPYCYSSDDDSSRREKSLQQHPLFKEKVMVRVVGLATASYQGDFSEDSSLGSIPSVIVRFDEGSHHSRDDSGFAGMMSQKGALDQSFEEKGNIRIGRTIVGVLESDAQSASSIESSMDSIPSLLKDSALPSDILHIDGEDENKDDASVDLISHLEEKVDSADLNHAENAKDDHRNLSVSFESSIPSPTTTTQQQEHHFQPEHCNNASFVSTEGQNMDARLLGEQMGEAGASPPPSPIQPTILEVDSYNDDDHRVDLDDIPVEENQKRSMFRKLLSCGSGMKTMIPTGAGKAFKAKAASFKRKGKTKSSANENTNFSFITTSSPSGMTYTSSPIATTPGSLTSSARSTSWGSSPSRTGENGKLTPSALLTPIKKKSNGRIQGVPPKSRQPKQQDPFTTPPKSSKTTKKTFDYRRPTPAAKERQGRTKSTSATNRSSPVSLILNSFERLTKKNQYQRNNNRSPRRTRRLKKVMSKLQGKKLPMLIAIGLAALCQSVLNNLNASNALTMLCAGSSTPLVLLWDGGFDAAVGGMTGFAQAMIAQG